MTNNYDPNQKRGGAANAGNWTKYENTDPEATLGSAGTATISREEARGVMEFIEYRAKRFAAKYRFSDQTREDMAQDTALDLLVQQKMFGLEETHSKKLINTAIRAVASRAIDPNVRHEDLTARALFKKVVAADERRMKRDYTSAEKKDIAKDIQMNAFPPGGRPGDDYYLENREFSIDRPVNNGDTTMTFGDSLTHEELGNPFAEDASAMAELVDGLSIKSGDELVDADGNGVTRLTPAQVRKEAWNHLAEVSDTPRATAGTLTKAAAATATAAVEAYPGGVAAMSKNWQDGETTEAEDNALFAPFGDLKPKDQEKVIEQLLRQPSYTAELWQSAAGIAARPAAG